MLLLYDNSGELTPVDCVPSGLSRVKFGDSHLLFEEEPPDSEKDLLTAHLPLSVSDRLYRCPVYFECERKEDVAKALRVDQAPMEIECVHLVEASPPAPLPAHPPSSPSDSASESMEEESESEGEDVGSSDDYASDDAAPVAAEH